MNKSEVIKQLDVITEEHPDLVEAYFEISMKCVDTLAKFRKLNEQIISLMKSGDEDA